MNIQRKGCLLTLALPIAILLLVAGPLDWWARYRSWSHLSKDKLVKSANWYIANRAPGNYACIFAVECKGDRASLKLVKSIDEWDLEATKRIVWDRKFKFSCQGRTANFALEVATDNPHSQETYEGNRRAVWSFSNDRFIPTATRFGYAAFSELETEPCLGKYAVTAQPR